MKKGREGRGDENKQAVMLHWCDLVLNGVHERLVTNAMAGKWNSGNGELEKEKLLQKRRDAILFHFH